MVWKRVSTKFPMDVSALRVLSGYVPAIIIINNDIIIFIKCYIIFEEFFSFQPGCPIHCSDRVHLPPLLCSSHSFS